MRSEAREFEIPRRFRSDYDQARSGAKEIVRNDSVGSHGCSGVAGDNRIYKHHIPEKSMNAAANPRPKFVP